MNRLSQETREGIVHSLVECASQRSCERRYKVSNKTVAKLANDVGEMAIRHIAQIKGLRVRQIQADELWAFVKVKQKNVMRQKVQEVGAGILEFYQTFEEDDPRKPLTRYRKVDERGPYRSDGNPSWPGSGGPSYDVLHPKTQKPVKVPSDLPLNFHPAET